MQVEVDFCAGGPATAEAELRLRFVLSRFAPAVLRASLRTVSSGPGRVALRARVQLVDGATVALAAEDAASDAAVTHFIDRLGRAVARHWSGPGGRHV